MDKLYTQLFFGFILVDAVVNWTYLIYLTVDAFSTEYDDHNNGDTEHLPLLPQLFARADVALFDIYLSLKYSFTIMPSYPQQHAIISAISMDCITNK